MNEAPDTVLSDRQRRRIAEQVTEEGLLCHCWREATDAQADRWLEHLYGDPEPSAWSCPDDIHLCSDCHGRGTPPGLSGPEVCARCDGQGEHDEREDEA